MGRLIGRPIGRLAPGFWRGWLVLWLVMLMVPWVTAMVWMRGVDGVSDMMVRAESDVDMGAEIGTEESEMISSSAEVRVLPEYRILMERDGVHTYMNLEDYLPGIVLCQTEPGMELEALKCQAVIARTYIYRLMDGRSEIDEKELDLSYPGEYDRGILGNQGSREVAIAALAQCEAAVQETSGVVMQYEGRCILPLFHKISTGRTRTGEMDFPYLQASESKRDVEAEGYLTELSWNVGEFWEKISGIGGTAGSSVFSGISAEALASQIQVVQKDDSGYVSQIKIGAKTYTGEEVQYALGLPSSCYSIFVSQGKVCARVQGVGHGYGLSQAGACAMARDGWGYEEILGYYYKGIAIGLGE